MLDKGGRFDLCIIVKILLEDETELSRERRRKNIANPIEVKNDMDGAELLTSVNNEEHASLNGVPIA